MTRNRPLRVLSVIGQLNVGGAETYLTRIAQRIRQYGIDMEICALDRVGPRLGELERAGIVVHDTPYGRRVGLDIFTLLKTIDTVRRIARKGRFDIVHTYLYWSDIMGVTGAWLARCPRIIVGRRALHSWIHAQRAVFHGLEQVTNAMANEVIANSEAVLRDAVATERFLPRVRAVIYNGIDVSDYDPRPRSANGPLRLVTVGALAPRKGQEYAIEALRLVSIAGVQATLVLVGSGSDEHKLRRLAAENGVERLITFAGEQLDPRPYLDAADVFLLPSRQEGFSNAILEAMASALPVIATDVGGNAEAVVHGSGGLIVQPERAEALAAAITELAQHRGEMWDMGRFNRERVAERFSLEASTRSLAGWYLDRSRPGTP